MSKLIPGQWVNAKLWPGVWKVTRIVPIAKEIRFSLSENRAASGRVIVFLQRLVNGKWQKSFDTRSCEQSLVTPLTASDQARVNQLLREDEKLRTAFEKYTPKPIDFVVNLSLSVPDREALQAFCDRELSPALAEGLSMDQVLTLMDKAGLAQFVYKYPINATLQLVCRDHEMRDEEFVLRDGRVLPY